MKELTIEQKAKRYDETIEKLRNFYRDYDTVSCLIDIKEELANLFPELKESKESKDEKIIERIKKAVTYYWSDEPLDEILVWLEKQGEKTSDKIVEKARTEKQRILLTETDGSANIDWDCRSLDDVKTLLKCGLEFIRTIEANKQILTGSRFGGCSFRVPTRYDKDIKQGEQILANSAKTCKDDQKPNPCDGCVNRKTCINCENGELRETEQKSIDNIEPKFKVGDKIIHKELGGDFIHNPHKIIQVDILDKKYRLEGGLVAHFSEQDDYELVEQKPADRVEPKFHEGDWVVSPNGVYWHIDKISNNRYEVTSNTGECANWPLDTNIYHSFSIQDAKDGDVLVSSSGKPFIFKGFFDNDPMAYGGLVADDSFWPASNSNWTTVYCKPATKEQRDTLMKAMADAGCTFDFEEKVLKKIEQKPAENKGINLVEEEMTPFQKKVFCIIDTSIEEEQGLKQVCEELLALAANEIEQKPADLKTKAGNWYVCDMEVMNENMVTAFRRGEIYYCPKDGYLDVRGALFEVGGLDVFRLATEGEIPQAQPKQEWSEEMGKLCLDAISLLRDYASGVDKNSQLGKKIGRADAFLSDLYHNAFYPSTYNMREDLRKAEWSEEDKYNHNIILYLLNNECVGRADKRIAIEWFKSLRPQKQWKPSDEQMEAMQKALVDLCGKDEHNIITSLYYDLKKLKEG